MLRNTNSTLDSYTINSFQNNSFYQKKYFKIQDQLYYQKLFFIKSHIQRDNAFKRHSLQIKNIPHFKITQNYLNYIKIQFKNYCSVYQLSHILNEISQVQKLTIIRQIFTTYVNLMQIYGFFCFDKRTLKIDENGKFIMWIYTDYQKIEAEKNNYYEGTNIRNDYHFRQKEATSSFLLPFRQFLNHKKIKQNLQLTISQLYEVLNQIQKKNQLISKCPTFIKNKAKISYQQPFNNRKINKKLENQQINTASLYAQASTKTFIVESLGPLQNKSKSKSKVKKLFSYNKDLLQEKNTLKNSQNKNCNQNPSLKCQIGIKDLSQVDQLAKNPKKSKRTCSNLQPCFDFPFQNHFKFLNKPNQSKKTHRRTNTDIKSPTSFFKKFIPNQKHIQYQNDRSEKSIQKKLCFAKSNKKIKEAPKKEFFLKFNEKKEINAKNPKTFKKAKSPLKNQIAQQNNFFKKKKIQNIKIQNKEQINHKTISRSMIKSSSTKDLVLKNHHYKEISNKLSKIKSCQNLSTIFMKQFQNTTSTAPTLKNCRSNQHFFLTSLNPFQCLTLQEELNQMFTNRSINASIHILDQQKYQELKCQVDCLLD